MKSLKQKKDKLSLIIPAHNEEEVILNTLKSFSECLRKNNIRFEIIVVNDNSEDKTRELVLNCGLEEVKLFDNLNSSGFGSAVVRGIDKCEGEIVAIVMADLSDSPKDLVSFYKTIQKGYDCVFGSRFIKGGKTMDYPLFKMWLNRFGNYMIKLLFWIDYNDMSNAFKMYRKETLEGLRPFLSKHFNLTVELPLKAIVRGYSYIVVPNSWINRKKGNSKFKIKEMGSRYFFIIFYCLLEKWLSKGDYKRI